MATDPDLELPRRRDEEGDFHELLADTCPHCGCTFYRAKDQPDLVWDPGVAWDENCGDRSCHCHIEPVIGAAREQTS